MTSLEVSGHNEPLSGMSLFLPLRHLSVVNKLVLNFHLCDPSSLPHQYYVERNRTRTRAPTLCTEYRKTHSGAIQYKSEHDSRGNQVLLASCVSSVLLCIQSSFLDCISVHGTDILCMTYSVLKLLSGLHKFDANRQLHCSNMTIC